MKIFGMSAVLMLALCTGLVACDTEKKSGSDADSASAEDKGDKAEGSDVVDDVVKAVFDKGLKEKTCEFLTGAAVAKAFSVPEAELEQLTVLGCIYNWEKGDEELQARVKISIITKTEADAVTWFRNATKGMSQAEAKAAMGKIKTQAKKDAKVDTDAKKEAVDELGDAAIDSNNKDGIRFRDIPGLGDEARLQLGDGAIWVRVDNMMFIVNAYKGKKAPPPSFEGGVDLENFANVALAANKKWIQDTMAERERDGVTVAKIVLEALPKN